MPDQAELELVISAQADRVLAGLSSFERALKGVEQQHQATAKATQDHLAALTPLENAFQRFQQLIPAISFALLIKQATDFDQSVYQLSQTLNGSAEAASSWIAIGERFGVQADELFKDFGKLSQSVETNSPALRQMGVATRDASGNFLSMQGILSQIIDYFHAHAGATNNAALANEVFGRSGRDLLPILEQGSATLQMVTEEARKYGLILDQETLQRNMAFTFQLRAAEEAGRGLAISLGNALLPAVAAVGQGLAKLVADNLPAFIAAVNRTVSYIVGFAEGVTGMKLAVDQSAETLGQSAEDVKSFGSASQDAASRSRSLEDSMRRIRDATQSATSALEAQIRALQQESEAETFNDRMAQLADDRAAKEKSVADLQADYDAQVLIGNFAMAKDVGDKMTKAKQDLATAERNISTSSSNEQRKTLIEQLHDQERAIQDDSQKRIEAMQAAARGMTDALVSATPAWSATMQKAGKDMAANLKFAMDSGAEATGKSAGEELAKQFKARDWGGVGNAIGNAIGQAIVTSMGTAASNSIRITFSKMLHDLGVQQAALAGKLDSVPGFNNFFPGMVGALKAEAFVLQQFHSGGTVPGPPNQEVLAVLRGQEVVQTPEQAKAAGNTVSITINGATDPEAVGRAVRRALVDALGMA